MSEPRVIVTPSGELPLHEYHLRLGDHAWRILHAAAVFGEDDEQRFLGAEIRIPYGLALWPSSVALAHDLATRTLAGKRLLELGAGTGLPGIVAATLGATVVQTDFHDVALQLCVQNARRNGASIEHRAADWTAWKDTARYDVVLGSDTLYMEAMRPHLRAIFDANLAPGGTLLLADPLRKQSVPLFEAMEADGWSVTMSKWTVGGDTESRAVGVYELRRLG